MVILDIVMNISIIGDSRPIVLLGEDEQFQARLVKTVLERKNFIVQVASDGITAYNIHNSKREMGERGRGEVRERGRADTLGLII